MRSAGIAGFMSSATICLPAPSGGAATSHASDDLVPGLSIATSERTNPIFSWNESSLTQHVIFMLGFPDYCKTVSLVQGSRRVSFEHAQGDGEVGAIGFRDDLSEEVGTQSLPLQFGSKLDLDEFPLCAVARYLQQADGCSILQQDFSAIEPEHQASKVVVVACTRARGGKVRVHCSPPKPHEERHVLDGGRATFKLNGLSGAQIEYGGLLHRRSLPARY